MKSLSIIGIDVGKATAKNGPRTATAAFEQAQYTRWPTALQGAGDVETDGPSAVRYAEELSVDKAGLGL